MGQGRKVCYLGGRQYDYSVGNYLAVFLPMPLEAVILEASPERPLLMVGIRIDLHKIASMLLKMDQLESPIARPEGADPTGIFSAPLHDDLLDPVIRLLRALDSPTDTAILGESILDEIHYRVLCDDHAGSLRYLLQQREQIQQISKAVEYIHQNMDRVISVEELAARANMSTSGFHRSFKEVMRLSPLQYAKSMKLHRAQALIREGRRANEAGYLVGYNSPAQFSREYKRLFGYSPSAT
jgi:AraC-like DNA-binding protein